MPGPGGHHGGGHGPGGSAGFGRPHGGPGNFGGPHGGPHGGPGPRPPYHGWGYGHRPHRSGCLGCLMPILGTIFLIVLAISFLII